MKAVQIPLTFPWWLGAQIERKDNVGELARFAADHIQPEEWPGDRKLDRYTALFEAHRELSATYMKADELPQLDYLRTAIHRAWHEWRQALGGQTQ